MTHFPYDVFCCLLFSNPEDHIEYACYGLHDGSHRIRQEVADPSDNIQDTTDNLKQKERYKQK